MAFYSPRRHRLIDTGILIVNLRRSSDRHRFIMCIRLPVTGNCKTVTVRRRLFQKFIETQPGPLFTKP